MVDASGVRFRYKDYRQSGKVSEMTLGGVEFLRRFSQHILPPGFRRMRHYGILSNALKGRALAACRRSLGLPAPEATPLTRQERRAEALHKLVGHTPDLCPHCRNGRMIKVGFFPPQRAPPEGCMPHWFVFEEA
jgi:Putative transposase